MTDFDWRKYQKPGLKRFKCLIGVGHAVRLLTYSLTHLLTYSDE